MKVQPDQMWTAEQKQLVRNLWSDGGLSASQIAKEVGRTRNSVISIIARMKLPKRGKDVAVGNYLAAMAKRRKPVPNDPAKQLGATKPARKSALPPKPKLAAVPKPEPMCQPLGPPLEALRLRGQCKFVINGDAPVAEYLFCGLDVRDEGSWCAHHRRIVFAGRVEQKEAA